MADKLIESPPGHNTSPGSPQIQQAYNLISLQAYDTNTAAGEEVPLLVPVIRSTMADELADSPPEYPFFHGNGLLAPLGHDAPIQGTQGEHDGLKCASGGGPQDDSRNSDDIGNSKDASELVPAGVFVRLYYNGQFAPLGDECSQVPLPATTSTQTPPAGHVSRTQGHPPANLSSHSQPPDPNKGLLSDVFSKKIDFIPKLPEYFVLPMHKCFALASIRVYDKNLRCDSCGGRSDLGWYYRCCHLLDSRLVESIGDDDEEHYDETGKTLTQHMREPTRGPAARPDRLSLRNELPAYRLEGLSAPQIAKIFRQREAALDAAMADGCGPCMPPQDGSPLYLPPLCKGSLCPNCGRGGGGEQQSFLNLDGVLKGDIPPTAAVGFGFRALGGHPVANANIVKNLGLRDPKTGLLPGQKAKGNAVKGDVSGGMSEVLKDAKLVERTATLKVDDAETSEDSEGPKTPESSQKADDSDEDLIQLYMDFEGNNADPIHDDERFGHTEGNGD